MTPVLQPVVSILTPVYNGADHLAACVESVLGQTYQNWDYAIVNNCSTDATADIARRYATQDSRIRVYDNQNFLPPVASHNSALRKVSPTSKYCKLLFGDDFLFPECLERMVALMEAHPSVGIVSSYGLQGNEVKWTGLPYPSTVVAGRDACRMRLLNGPYVFGTGTTHMIRADFVRSRDPFYNESNLHCDSEMCFQLLQTSDFGFIHQILSYTREYSSESVTTFASRLHTLDAMSLYELVTYGPIFLTPEEYSRALEAKLNDYYAYLAHSVLEGGESWAFHTQKLHEFGLKLDRGRLAKAVMVKAASAFYKNPKRTIEKLLTGKSAVSGRLNSLARRSVERS
ncbi:MAG TPA: glycosyltransferase family A protein [Terriglobales bacterium]|nr:glycosyltransferase family A protein [Terriglobales bacterium]